MNEMRKAGKMSSPFVKKCGPKTADGKKSDCPLCKAGKDHDKCVPSAAPAKKGK